MRRILAGFLMIIAISGCNIINDNPEENIKSVVVLNGSSEEYLSAKTGGDTGNNDLFILNGISVEEDSVYVSVSYSGGCRQHTFEVIWGEEFLETEPQSLSLILLHDADDDACEAFITETLAFSISDLTGEISFDTVCVSVINGVTLSDSISAGGWDPADTLIIEDNDYEVIFPQGSECVVNVVAARAVCGIGLYNNLWFALQDSVSTGVSDFYFRKYLQPVAISSNLAGFVPVEGKKYKLGAVIQNEHPYSGVPVCLAYSGPSVPVRINCITAIE